MTEVVDLPEITEANVSDDDLLLIYDVGAASDKSRKCTRANFLKDVVRTSGEFDVETLNATVALNGPAGAIETLTVSTGLVMGATVSKVLVGSASVTIPSASAQSQVTATMAVTGAQVGDMVTIHGPSTLTAGLILRGVVTAVDVVTVYAFNASSGTIASAAHALKALVIRAA